MLVRAYDKDGGYFYKSFVYGKVNIGYYEQAILFDPRENCFKLVNHLDKRENTHPLPPLYEHIVQTDDGETVDWEGDALSGLKEFLKERGFQRKLDFLAGYREVCEDFEFLLRIFRDKKVPLSETNLRVKDCFSEWNYIFTQEDADAFMAVFEYFHDASLKKLTYEEKRNLTRVTAIFDNSCWFGTAELCFEGLIEMHIEPRGELYMNEISCASLLVKDECVFWADDEMEEENLSYGGDYIKAMSLKWRKIEDLPEEDF